MELSANALVTLEAVKSYLEVSNDSVNDRLEDMINWVSAECEAYCDRHFNSQTYTEYYDGDATDTLILPHYPIVSVTSIYDDTERLYSADSLLDSDDYMLIADEGVIVLDGDLIWSKGKQNIKITYVAGYSATAIPYDVQHAVLEWIATLWKKMTEKRFGVSGVSVGDKNINYSNDPMPVTVQRRLGPYKNRARHGFYGE